jgi:hypothetical protein
MRILRISSGIALVASAAAACAVRGEATYAEPVGTVEVTSAPVVNYEAYPHTVYQGRTVYYVNNRWGYPHPGGWSYYRTEPQELVRYRHYVETAPPAPRYQRPRYEQREREPEREAPPPAVQVR